MMLRSAFVVCLLSWFLVPAAGVAQENGMPVPDGHADLQAFAAAYTAAWNSGQPEQVAAFFAPSGSLTVNDGDTYAGREAITGLARGFMEAFPDLRILLDGVQARGGRAIYRWRFMGTNSGAEGTGKKVDFSGFEVWRFDDSGLVAESRGFFDSEEYERQVAYGVEENDR